MSFMRATKVKETNKEWFKIVKKFTLMSSSLKPLSAEFCSAKNCSRDERGQSEKRVHLQSLTFFHIIKNMQHLFSLFVNYLCAVFIHQCSLPILAKDENETRMSML